MSLEKVKNKPKNKGTFTISEMFKSQSQKKKIRNEQFGKQKLSSETKLDVEIIDVDDLPDNCDKPNNLECVESIGKSSQLETQNGEHNQNDTKRKDNIDLISISDKSHSRLSLKRKSDSEFLRESKITTGEKSRSSNTLEHNNIEKAKEEHHHQANFAESEREPGDSGVAKEDDPSYSEVHQPYYQRNFETILNSVIGDADVSYLFSEADHAIINAFLSLSEQARRLYIRLFGRKFKWIPLSKIKYNEIAENLIPHLNELTKSQLVHNEDSLTNLRDVMETLTAGDMKTMSKLYHVASSLTQKKQIIEELIKLSQRSTVSSMFGSKGGIGASMLKKAKTLVHGAYKLQLEPRSVFIRIMMLFSLVNTTGDEDSGNGGQGQLFQMLMVNIGKVVYPSYKIEKKHKVFKSREDVIRFENALQLETDLLHCIEKANWPGAYDLYCSILKQLEKLLEDEETNVWNENLPDFLRCFCATSVLYGLLSQGIEILQRRKAYDDAVTLIWKLLDQHIYCCTHRGYWWERLALNLDVHLKQPLQSLEAIASGLEDKYLIIGHRLALFQRAEAICERPRLKLKERLKTFYHRPIIEIPKVYLEGRILHHGMTTSGPRFLTEGSYVSGNSQDMTVCGVEEFVMEHYRKNGYPQGLHAEGSIVTSLFGLFFWDILFMSVPDAFHSLYQAQPLDLYSSTSFYSARQAAIDERLTKLENSSTEALNKMVEETWTNEHGKLCVGMNWDRLQSLDDVNGLVSCIGGKSLSGILGRYAKCPRHTRSGFPDLTLWNVQTGDWKICEVKGPGDKLSHKQILWLDHLLSIGVDAEVCHVKAVAAKKLRPSTSM